MRRFNNLFNQITSFQNLLKAAQTAQKNKRFKENTLRFNFNLEHELFLLQNDLLTLQYKPGRYYHFIIYEPKRRRISAAPYRDRIVHHAIYNILEPVFDPTFIYDSYATRKSKGTHRAINRFQEFSKQNQYVLKCDIKKYFQNISRPVLFDLIKKKVSCKKTLKLIQIVINGNIDSCPDNKSKQLDLFSTDGIPIGNLTSQFFANIYLNGFDHFIKEKLKCTHYVRYMDDFMVFNNSKTKIWEIKTLIQEYLNKINLSIHEGKCRIFKTIHGVPFLGMIVYPNKKRLKRQNVVRFKRRLKKFSRLYEKQQVTWQHISQSIQSWIGYAKHADSWRLRELVLWDHPI